ncbi:hypothetical protein [Streptomyces virginiae]|uniref:hypothetical protein n=1 Tax=Streptomyces virginiae TaxID=1961 RepID=UPI003248E456
MNDPTNQAAAAITEALRNGHDVAELIAHALCQVAADEGGIEEVLRNRSGSWEAGHLRSLMEGTAGPDGEGLEVYRKAADAEGPAAGPGRRTTDEPEFRPVVRPETVRYAEELRANPGTASSDGHAGWECTAGASLHVEAMTPGPGRLGTLHGVIYVCPEHQAAAEERVTAGGYGPEVSDAPYGHRFDPWPCGHVTTYNAKALAALAGQQETGAQR